MPSRAPSFNLRADVVGVQSRRPTASITVTIAPAAAASLPGRLCQVNASCRGQDEDYPQRATEQVVHIAGQPTPEVVIVFRGLATGIIHLVQTSFVLANADGDSPCNLVGEPSNAQAIRTPESSKFAFDAITGNLGSPARFIL